MSLAVRDPAILAALLAHKHLTSGQLSRLLGASQQGLRRGIRRRLLSEGFVVRVQRLPTEEAAYALGSRGFEFLADQRGFEISDLPYPKKVSRTRTLFWKHDSRVNDVSIAFALACDERDSPLHLQRTVPEHELMPNAPAKAVERHRRYVLAERFKTDDGNVHIHRPDALYLVHPTGKPTVLAALFLELDRASESMPRITKKLAGFWHYWRQRRYGGALQADGMRVLFVLDGVTRRTRMHSMQQTLLSFASKQKVPTEAFLKLFLFAHMKELNERTLLTEPIWFDVSGKRRLLFQPVAVTSVSVAAEDAA